jgi:putative CocE/NonD family hydrolase
MSSNVDDRPARSGLVGRVRDGLVDRMLKLPRDGVAPVVVQRDVRVPMPDGVDLLADRHAPATGVDQPRPVVLVRTPYGRRGPLGLVYGAPFARRGLQVVIQSVRGTFGSGGSFHPFHDERDDGLATVAWLREQPWCDGRVAMMGASYLGYTQWAVAPYVDPPLAALCPAVTGSEFNSATYLGGGVGLRGAFEWSMMVAQQESGRLRLLLSTFGPRAARARRAMAGLPLADADEHAIGQRSAYWQEVVEHSDPDDDFWRLTDHSAGTAKLGTTPISMYTCWWDIFLINQLRDVVALQEVGNPPRLTIGAGAHADIGTMAGSATDALDHLRTVLLGAPPTNRARVRLWLQHGERWIDAEQWPPAAQNRTYYLRPGGELGAEPAADAAPDVTTYDPADPTPTVGGPVIGRDAGAADNRAIEARPDVLCYTGPVLAADLDIVGEVSATVRLRSEPGYADVFVRLCDVEPTGKSMSVTDGFVRLRPGSPEPDGVVSVTSVEVALRPTAYRLRAGHRLRVQVSGGAYPRFARNLGTGEPAVTATRMVTARRETFGGSLTLPVYAG